MTYERNRFNWILNQLWKKWWVYSCLRKKYCFITANFCWMVETICETLFVLVVCSVAYNIFFLLLWYPTRDVVGSCSRMSTMCREYWNIHMIFFARKCLNQFASSPTSRWFQSSSYNKYLCLVFFSRYEWNPVWTLMHCYLPSLPCYVTFFSLFFFGWNVFEWWVEEEKKKIHLVEWLASVCVCLWFSQACGRDFEHLKFILVCTCSSFILIALHIHSGIPY